MDINNKQLLYKIMCARDKRYDGRFYCGVHTTGIYCRPICPARPKIDNITFYRSSTEAEKAGFRACLRCRPDLAPNSAQWNGTAAVVGRAFTLISRIDVAISKRLHLAKQLLTQSTLSVTEIAFASGYQSIRQFNHAFKDRFRLAPTLVRKSTDRKWDKNSNFIHIELPVIEPYDWDHIFGFLKNHQIEGVENFVNGHYQRSFAIEKSTGAIEIGYEPQNKQLSARLSISDPAYLRIAIEQVRDLFDTRMNPHAHLYDLKLRDPISGCYRKALGIRIPGAWESFETAVCIILGQLVSVEQARSKVKSLVAQFGTKISNPTFDECTHLFPSPLTLANASFKNIGVTKVREQAIRELSQQVLENRIDLSRSADIAKTKALLLAIKGIGPWTVEMIAMRCLGDTNAFPKNDLIIKRALQHHKNEKGNWSPWNAYIALALWKTYATTLSKKRTKSTNTK